MEMSEVGGRYGDFEDEDDVYDGGEGGGGGGRGDVSSRRASEFDADDTRALIALERNIQNIERSMNANNGKGSGLQNR